MKRYQLKFGIALVLLSLLGGSALAADHGQEAGTLEASNAASSIQGSRVPGDLLSGLESSCTISEDLSERESFTTLAELAKNLESLLASDVYETQLIQLARYLMARDVADFGLEKQHSYTKLLEQIAVGDPEDMIPVLEDLKDRVLLTAQLRETRATLAGLRFTGDGKIQLTLKLDTSGANGGTAIDRAILSEFDKARRHGVDCSSSDVFRVCQARLADLKSAPETKIRHRDLQTLLTRIEAFERMTARYASSPADGLADAPNVQDIVETFQEIQQWHAKAQDVLGQALAQYKTHLAQFFDLDEGREPPTTWEKEESAQPLPLAVQAPRVEDDVKDNPVSSQADAVVAESVSVPEASAEVEKGAGVAPPEVEGAIQAEKVAAVTTADIAPAPSAELPQASFVQPRPERVSLVTPPGPQLAESSSTQFAAVVPTDTSVEAAVELPSQAEKVVEETCQATPSSAVAVEVEREPSVEALSADEPEPTPDMLAQQKAEIIDEVMTQVDILRRQAGENGAEDMIQPLALANNLLFRSKRVFQLADMLVLGEKDDQIYSCSISDDRVHIAFKKKKSALASMSITVDEKYLDQTLMSWTISVNREDDENFQLDAEFDGMKSSLVVEDAKVVRFPNHHELLVLMNRLSDVADVSITPVRTASR